MKIKVDAVALAALALLAGCDQPQQASYPGYAEGEYVFVAAGFAGQLERLAVTRGAQVEAGGTLFVLEHAIEEAALAAARARAAGAQARIANLSGARRASEIDALRASIERANAAQKRARIVLEQDERLLASGFISERRLAESRAAAAESSAQVRETEAQLRSALQSLGRSAEIAGARADFEAARAEIAQAAARRDQKTGVAPAPALVQDTLFREGEWVPAGVPVVSLLPPANVKVRFFVPQAIVGSLRAGQEVQLACDGCGSPITARVNYISSQAEFTPPVIYSRESRAKLVFLIEARPAAADAPRLRPGLPVDVTLGAATPGS